MNDYILINGKPVKCLDMDTWQAWKEQSRETGECRVAYTEIGDKSVSTVFLGYDTNFGEGVPMVYESLVGDETHRYATLQEAQSGHDELVEKLRIDSKIGPLVDLFQGIDDREKFLEFMRDQWPNLRFELAGEDDVECYEIPGNPKLGQSDYNTLLGQYLAWRQCELNENRKTFTLRRDAAWDDVIKGIESELNATFDGLTICPKNHRRDVVESIRDEVRDFIMETHFFE